MLKPVSYAAALAAGTLLVACGSLAGHHVKKSVDRVKPKARLEDIRRAQVWAPTDVPSMDLKIGPKGHGAFAPGETVNCTYVKKEMTGRSPKFECAIPPDDEVKVKFGRGNGEVYAEVAATWLFWALGFPVDRMYPVHVVCTGCPPSPDPAREAVDGAVVFDFASIERKLSGRPIEIKPESGWEWSDLDTVDEDAGGATWAQRDALKLLAVFVQHTDNKAEQQRLLCLDEKGSDDHAVCAHPVMMVNDLGQTFGRSNLFNRDSVGSVNLTEWSKAHVWTDAKSCVGDLPPTQTGSLHNPPISEAGRKFLSGLLTQLSDAQLRDLFAVSRFPERAGVVQPSSVDAWVDAFKKKRGEIAGRICPS